MLLLLFIVKSEMQAKLDKKAHLTNNIIIPGIAFALGLANIFLL